MNDRQRREVKSFEKSYTAVVNNLASHPDRSASISLSSGKSAVTTAGEVAGALINRVMVKDFNRAPLGMGTDGDTSYIGPSGLSGKGTLKGRVALSAEQSRRLQIAHEGMHGSAFNELDARLGHIRGME